MLERGADAAGLQRALCLLAEPPYNRDCFWSLFDELRATPDFLRVYFSDDAKAQYSAFTRLMARVLLLDAFALRAILQDFWELRPIDGPIALGCPVDLVFGKYDMLSDPSEDEAVWLQYFAQARSRHLDAGHFVHLERPPAEWWPLANRAGPA